MTVALPDASLQIDTAAAARVLTLFLRAEIVGAGFRRGVVGLSGGIDSALACALAAAALGPENVLAMRLPYRISSADSLDHAQEVVDLLGVQTELVDITPVVEPLFDSSPGITPHRRGNVMARARMIVLYDRSAAWDALVVGTSNKTELLLGYGTLFGDLASAVNPLGDLYKTQVRQLARSLGLPAAIIDKAPSADLIPGQTDEGDLGFTYADVDRLLWLLVEERYSPAEAVEAGFEAAFVDRVTRLIHRHHFKRHMPVVPRLGGRSIGHDFRYLRDTAL